MANAWSVHEGLGLRFPCTDRTDEVNKWYYCHQVTTNSGVECVAV